MPLGRSKKEYHKRNGLRCWYCGVRTVFDEKAQNGEDILATVDHQTPVSRGGSSDEANMVTACLNCNRRKAFMTVEEYRVFLIRSRHKNYITFYGERELSP